MLPKTIVTTGASSGIGSEMARQFAATGHDLVLCAAQLDKLEQLQAELLYNGGHVEVRGTGRK